MPKYRILSLDGGGIRGIITAIILERLNSDPTLAGWLGQANLIAGTSTGGLLALGLTHGLGPEALRSFYEDRGDDVFEDSVFDDIKDLGKLRGADYNISRTWSCFHSGQALRSCTSRGRPMIGATFNGRSRSLLCCSKRSPE